ncbi:MAG: hypothetical protein AAFQ94_06720 [Bacteroidota bacterium]
MSTEEESIYIVRGGKRSALINLDTLELRAIENSRIDQLADHVEMQPNLNRLIKPTNNVYDKEILDIRLLQEHQLSDLDSHLRDGMVYHNVRILCPEDTLIHVDNVRTLAQLINQKIYHFGIIIFISDAYDTDHFKAVCRTEKVITYSKEDDDGNHFTPQLHSSARAIQISQSHNLFHYSRDTIMADGESVKFIDHDQYDVPKHQIEACKECEFRMTCYDSREVREDEMGRYYYDTICKYENPDD